MGAARVGQLARVGLAACAFWLTSCGLFGGGGPTTVQLSGRVLRSDTNAPIGGVMITARDDERAFSVSVFTNDQGRYRFPGLYEGTYRIRARRVGFEPAERQVVGS